MPSTKLLIGLVVSALMLGCGSSAPKVVYKQQAILCPPEAIECDCDDVTDPRDVGDLFGLQIEALTLYQVNKCLGECQELNFIARDFCEEQIKELRDGQE